MGDGHLNDLLLVAVVKEEMSSKINLNQSVDAFVRLKNR